MLKRLIVLGLALFIGSCFASEPILKGYDEYQIPSGYHIPIMSLQEFSTAITEEGEKLKFLTTNDIYLFNKNVIPQGTRLEGYIEKKNEPIRGTNASMKVFINKMFLPDGFEIPIKAYIQTSNNNLIGGELTAPETYDKIVTVMKVQHALDSYSNYEEMRYYPDALNSLLKGLKKYDDNIEKARQLEVDDDLGSCKRRILGILSDEFGLSESEAYDILSLDTKAYTDKVVKTATEKY